MTELHPSDRDLELYAMGAHDEVAPEPVEEHLRSCGQCALATSRHEAVEAALEELARAAAFCPGCHRVCDVPRCPACGAAVSAGRYRIERVIVENAHGRIYLAHDDAGHRVALKELAFVKAPAAEQVEAFAREARVLRQLRHLRIPQFVDAFHEGEGIDTRFYLAQEYIAGESLDAALTRHQFTEREAIDVARQVLDIVEYLQGLSPMVFHRDIKPANLIRQPDGQIALVDFGAARDLGATVGATLVGTFGYMPIEQMGGIVDATSDVYALGATICQLLSRKEPWRFLEDPEAVDRLNVSMGLRRWLRKATARRAEDRFRTVAEARTSLPNPERLAARWSWPHLGTARPIFALGSIVVSVALSLGIAVATLSLWDSGMDSRYTYSMAPVKARASARVASEVFSTPPTENDDFEFSVEVSNKLSRGGMSSAIGVYSADIRRCYAQALAMRPRIGSGSVNVQFVIEPSGAAKNFSAVYRSLADPDLPSCILRTTNDWTFPKSAAATPVKLSFTFEAGSPAVVEEGRPSVSSNGLEPGKIAEVVRLHAQEVKACFVKELEHGQLAGILKLGFTIGASGKVSGTVDVSMVTEVGHASAEFPVCLIGFVTKWQFPKPSSPVDVTFPFVLEKR